MGACYGCNGCGKCRMWMEEVRGLCPKCKVRVPPDARTCPKCGFTLPLPPGMTTKTNALATKAAEQV